MPFRLIPSVWCLQHVHDTTDLHAKGIESWGDGRPLA